MNCNQEVISRKFLEELCEATDGQLVLRNLSCHFESWLAFRILAGTEVNVLYEAVLLERAVKIHCAEFSMWWARKKGTPTKPSPRCRRDTSGEAIKP